MKKISGFVISLFVVSLFLVSHISAEDNVNITRFADEIFFQYAFFDRFLSSQEIREKICGFEELNSEIEIQNLCNEKYNELSIKDKDSVQDVIDNADSIFSDESKSDEIKLITHELLASTLPRDAYENEVNLPKGYDEFLKEMKETTKRIRENCPKPGFSSAWFSYSILFDAEKIKGNIKKVDESWYHEHKFELIGPCAQENAGSAELTNIYSESLTRTKLLEIYSYYKNKSSISESENASFNHIFFEAGCHSFNCPKHYEELKSKCKEGYPIYNLVDYAAEGSSKLEEIKEMWDRWSHKNNCKGRGEDLIKKAEKIVEKFDEGITVELSHNIVDNKKCRILDKNLKQSFFIGFFGSIKNFLQNLFDKENKEKECGFANMNYTNRYGENLTRSVRYCCCSCPPKNLTENFWIIQSEGNPPKEWTDLQINNITEKPKVWMESSKIITECGGRVTAEGKVSGLIDNIFDIHFAFGFSKTPAYGGQTFFNKNSKSFYSLSYATKPGDYFYKIYAVLKNNTFIDLKEGEFKIEACKEKTPEKISEPVCGDEVLNQVSEKCDPPGQQSQCYEGEICNNNCLCESVVQEVVCGDGIRDVSELCDGNQFSQQCLDSHQTYLEMNPDLVLECYNNCRGCQSIPARE